MIFSLAHSFINIFADGRSDIKTILFLVYLASLGIIYLIFKKRPIKKFKWLYFGIPVVTMYLYGLIMQLSYILINKIPLTRSFIIGNNGEMSYSSIWHIHITKASIGVLFPHLSKTDAGGAYLGSFPNWLFCLGTILLIIILSEAIFYFVTSFRTLLKNNNNRQIIFLIIGYTLLTFSLIKTSVDGGLFQPAFLIGSIFVILFILRLKNKLPKYHYYISAALGLILMLINIYQNHLVYGSGWPVIQSATLIFLYNLIFYGSEKKIKAPVLILFIVLFLTSWYLFSYRDRGIYQYSHIEIPAQKEVYVYDKNMSDVIVYKNEVPQTISELAKKLDKNLDYVPIIIPGVNCRENITPTKTNITLISEKALSNNYFTDSKYIQIKNYTSSPHDNKWKTYLTVYLQTCAPDHTSLINAEFRRNNIENYLYYGN